MLLVKMLTKSMYIEHKQEKDLCYALAMYLLVEKVFKYIHIYLFIYICT